MTPSAPVFDRSTKSIVVIDDTEDLAAMTVLILELEGYTVQFALTGAAGLSLVLSSRPHAVLLDYMLPDMTGGDVGDALRANPETCDMHILMCSGTAEAVVRESFTSYCAFLKKPVAAEDLLQALDQAFTLH